MNPAGLLNDETVRAAAAGSAAEAGQIVAALTQQVRAMTITRLLPRASEMHAVDDLVQQVFAGMAQSLPTLRTPTVAGLKSLLSVIVSHRVSDYLRTLPATPLRSLDSTLHDLSGIAALRDFVPASGLSPQSTFAREEAIRLILIELGRLPEGQREIITLAYFDQLPVGEIAERIGISRAAACMQLIRATRSLRRAVTGLSQVHHGTTSSD